MAASMDHSIKKKRKSFGLYPKSPLRPLTPMQSAFTATGNTTNTLSKTRTPSSVTTSTDISKQPTENDATPPLSPLSPISPKESRTSTWPRRARPSSIFGSLRSIGSRDEDRQSSGGASSKAPSVSWEEDNQRVARTRQVISHGEAQTCSGIFFKKRKEYIVLTETSLLRFKNQARASEAYTAVPPTVGGRRQTLHSSISSISSAQDLQSFFSSSSGECDVGVPLHQIVAVYRPTDGRSSHPIDVAYLDNEQLQPSVLSLSFADKKDGDSWTIAIRDAANKARLSDVDLLPHELSAHVARAVEIDHDYDPARFKVYKVMVRSSGGSICDDTSNLFTSAICFLAFGMHKLHLIHIPKSTFRAGSLVIDSLAAKQSFGYLTLQALSINTDHESFRLTFRKPLQEITTLLLASLASEEIIDRLRQFDAMLRPLWPRCPSIHGLDIDKDIVSADSFDPLGYAGFDGTLTAFCIAYCVDPSNVCYTVYDDVEDTPSFHLLRPADQRVHTYNNLELLAIMRALRYNECFVTLSFAGISLDGLQARHDPFGPDILCLKSRLGMRLHARHERLSHSSMMVQEVQALALSSRSLRKLDFSACSSNQPREYGTGGAECNGTGCGVLEALSLAFKMEDANIDSLVLNGIQLEEVGIEYLVGMMAKMGHYLRAAEMSRCGLDDRALALVLDTLASKNQTLERLNISANVARLNASIFQAQVAAFHRLRSLDLSDLSFTVDPEPLIPTEVLSAWPLERLILSGTLLNRATVDSLASYLSSTSSGKIAELKVDRCRLAGSDVAQLLHSMTWEAGASRELHLDVSDNDIERGHDAIIAAISSGSTPSHLSMRGVVHDGQDLLRKLALGLAANRTIRYLDISMGSLPGEMTASTAEALERMFSENGTLEVVDISGEDSRTGMSSFGDQINQALKGLKRNRMLKILSINNQKLGLKGASTLADILAENGTLRELHCENNDMRLHGFTDLIDALEANTTLLYLSGFERCREKQLKGAALECGSPRKEPKGNAGLGLSTVRRTIASIAPNYSRGKPLLQPTTQQGSPPMLKELHEGWDKQARRLERILIRNADIANGVFDLIQVQNESDGGPATAGSFTELVEDMQFDSTPTLEKQLQLGYATYDGHGPYADHEKPADLSSDATFPISDPLARAIDGGAHSRCGNVEIFSGSTLRQLQEHKVHRHRQSTSTSSVTVLAAVNGALLEAMESAVTSLGNKDIQ